MKRLVKVRDIDGNARDTKWIEWDDMAVPGPPGPASCLKDDTDPTLNADLKLNGYKVIGEMEHETLVIDGGLL